MTTRGLLSFEFIPEKHGNCKHLYNDYLNVDLSLKDNTTVDFVKSCKRCGFNRKVSRKYNNIRDAKAFIEEIERGWL